MIKHNNKRIYVLAGVLFLSAVLTALLMLFHMFQLHFRFPALTWLIMLAVYLLCGLTIWVCVRVLFPLIRIDKWLLQQKSENGNMLNDEVLNSLSHSEFINLLIKNVVYGHTADSNAKTLNAEVALYALQSEINPHFLYNTLDAIRNCALQYGLHDISDMTLAMAQIFRYSISRPGEVATLSDEINNVKNYIKIQNYRFPDRFTTNFEIDMSDSRIMNCTLPVLTLQPIVENALTHGVENTRNKSCITVRAVVTEKTLYITIIDNGIGIPAEKLAEIRTKLKSGYCSQTHLSRHSRDKKAGISLYNVNRRLQIYFGPEYGLDITSCEGKFTSVEIVVPITQLI